ncbi:MAG: hypothetical protein M1832_006275 [Thelocarpon impressellum]|nr:MAG: hypothetical protein M1832_006275 [Thelocarpon impressellum]
MKYALLLPLAAAATAFVVPDEQVMSRLIVEPKKTASFAEKLPTKDEVYAQLDHAFSSVIETSKSALDDAFSRFEESGQRAKGRFQCMKSMTAFDVGAWLKSAAEEGPLRLAAEVGTDHGHHHHKHNKTVWELIAESKYTTKFAKVISEETDLVKVLNSTEANYTVFAPTDEAFEHLPKHGKMPSKEQIKKTLMYHVSPDFYPAGRVLASHTIPTLLKEATLGDEQQRLRVGLSLKGLTVNFFSRIIAVNIFGSNGVIHGIDRIIFTPPPTLDVIELFPGEYSTLALGLHKTGLHYDFEHTAQTGGTFFAPDNFAFQKLGPKINAFLFSKYGEKYLKGLLKYHVISNTTLYSDAFYPYKGPKEESIPKGVFHVDLPTLLEDRYLSVDVARYGGFISIKINGFTDVAIQDGIAKDGVIQILSDVLIPPKKLGGKHWQGEELSVEELKERLEPLVDQEMEL